MITIEFAKRELKILLNRIYEPREATTITQMLLQALTGFSSTEMLVNSKVILTTPQYLFYKHALVKLNNNTPIQQVLGFCWFDNEQYIVNRDVLIPRPETEELIDWIKKEVVYPKTVVDIGTGSGIIALSLKKYFSNALVHAVDVSSKALFVAKQNAVSKSRVIQWHNLNFLDEATWESLPLSSIIVSNPPYIKQQEENSMKDNVLQHEPHIALFVPNNNALVFYEAIAKFAIQKLEPNGCIFVEINESLGKETCNLFEQFGFNTILKKDLQQKDRMIKAWKN